jgi:microcystin degradation protein MlrC
MVRVLIAELKQETATFNPVPTRYDDFRVYVGEAIIRAYAGTRTELAGALTIFQQENVEVVPTVAASAVSGGPINSHDLDRLLRELADAVRLHENVDGLYVCLHAWRVKMKMIQADCHRVTRVVSAVYRRVPRSTRRHGSYVSGADLLVPYHTYPHIDQYETGQCCRNLMRVSAQFNQLPDLSCRCWCGRRTDHRDRALNGDPRCQQIEQSMVASPQAC